MIRILQAIYYTTKEYGANWNEWISFSSPNRCKKKIMFSAAFLLDNKFSFYEKHYNFPNVWESVCLQKQQHLLHGTNRGKRSEFFETRRHFLGNHKKKKKRIRSRISSKEKVLWKCLEYRRNAMMILAWGKFSPLQCSDLNL